MILYKKSIPNLLVLLLAHSICLIACQKPPVASISTDLEEEISPLKVHLTNASSDTVWYKWDFKITGQKGNMADLIKFLHKVLNVGENTKL